jgi:pyridoxal phosphate enzyme (YggS family)
MSIKINLEIIQGKVDSVCRQWQRESGDVHLIAVSKKQPQEHIIEALEAGQRIFGENIVQDAQKTWVDSGLKDKHPDVQLHFIGGLQTNKVKDAVALFDAIHCVDRPKLVDTLIAEMERQEKVLDCFIQVNTGEEDQKSGVIPSELKGLLDHCTHKGLAVSGLMCIPPVEEPSGLHFAFLKKLSLECSLSQLSMGMSSDFEKALALGATHIRVGTDIFGARS